MGTGCSVARAAPSTISLGRRPDWLELEPHQHPVNLSDSRDSNDIKLTVLVNDSVLWSYSTGLYTKWRLVEVFKSGTQYLPIEGGANIVLDREHSEIESVFHFPVRIIFAVIPNAIEFSPNTSISFFVRIQVAPRNPMKCAVTESGFEFPSLVGQIGLAMVFYWRQLDFAISIGQGEVNFEFNIFKITNRYDSEFGRSGQIIFTPNRTGVITFAVWKGEDEIIDICSLRTRQTTLSHLVEVRKSQISPLVSEITSGTLVLFHLKDTNIAFSDENYEDISEKIYPPYFYRTFTETDIHKFVTIDDLEPQSGLIFVLPTFTQHKIKYTRTEFDSIVLQCKTGDTLCFTNVANENSTKFTVKSTRNVHSNLHESFNLQEELINKHFQSGYIEFRVVSMGVHIFMTEEHNFLVVIASQSPKIHNVMVDNRGFSPNIVNITLHDRVLWFWGGQSLLHNIVQVTFNGDSIEASMEPLYSGVPSSNNGFHNQFEKVGNYYYISEGHSESVRGEIIVWPTPKVHIIPCTVDLALQPTCIEVSVNDWVVWISQPGFSIEIEVDSVVALDIDSYLTRMNSICYAFNVPLSGLIRFNFKISFAGLAERLEIPFCVVSDEILASNTILFPLSLSDTERCVENGDCLLLNSNKERRIDIQLNYPSSVDSEPILIPLDPFERILLTFWKQGLYKLTHSDCSVNVNVGDNVTTSKTPLLLPPIFNEISSGQSLELESDCETAIFTLDCSYPNLGRPNTQILSEPRVTFHKEGLYIVRTLGMNGSCLNSRVHTTGPILVTKPGRFSYRPNFSFEVISHTSVLFSWDYARRDVESIFQHSLIHNEIPVIPESVNTCILTDLTPETEQQITLEISHFESHKLLASIQYSFHFPLYCDTIAPIITIDKDPPSNLARISWDRHIHTIPIVGEYAVYVDRQLNCIFSAVLTAGSNDRGDETKCVVLLEDLEEGELYCIQVAAIAKTFEGTMHNFKSQEIMFNNLNSKSLTSEEPKLTSTDFDSRSVSIESDVSGESVGEISKATSSTVSLLSEDSIKTLEKSDEIHFENSSNGSAIETVENPVLTPSNQSNVLESESLNKNCRVELGVKSMALDFIEVFWRLVDDTQEVMNVNLDSLVLFLNKIQIYSTCENSGTFKLSDFPIGAINHLAVEAHFYEYSINPTRCSSEIFFAKPKVRLPDSLVLKETDTQLKNSIEFKFKNIPSVCLKYLKLKYKPEIGNLGETLKSFFSNVESICYTLREEINDGEENTFSNTISLKDKYSEIASAENPRISISTSKKLLTLHHCNPGHTYKLEMMLIYSESEIQASGKRYYIFPFESEIDPIEAISAAPPTLHKPILSSLTRSGIRIEWKKPFIVKAPIIGFVVCIDGTPIGDVLDISVRDFHYTTPKPGNTYKFTIKALTNHPCGNSNGISYVELQPISSYDACFLSPPLEVLFEKIMPLPRITSFTPCVGTSVKVEWNVEDLPDVFLTPDCFTLSWQPVGSPLECRIQKSILYRETSKFSYKLLGLTPWTEYELEICSYAKDGNVKGNFITTKCRPHVFTSIGPPVSPTHLKTESVWFDKIRTVWGPIDQKFVEMVPSHIWAFVYYKNKVFVRLKKINNSENYFEMENLKPDTLYLIEFYGVLDSLNLQFAESSDPIEGYEMRNKILLSLHSCVCYEVRTLSVDFDISLDVVFAAENTLFISWSEVVFTKGVKMLSYSLECGTDDTLDDIQFEDLSKQRQISTLSPETNSHTFKNLISGLLYKIQLKSQLIESDSDSNSIPYTVLLRETRFRLPAPPEKPIFFLSEITTSTVLLTWNKSRSHFATDSNIRTAFNGYNLFVNDISHRILQRNTTKYSFCVKKPEVLKIKLIALGTTLCQTKSDKKLVFDETNESEIMNVDLDSFWTHFESFSIHFIKLEDLLISDSIGGYVAVSWKLKQEFIPYILTIKLIWWHNSNEIQNEIMLPSAQTEFQIEKPIPKDIYCAQLYLNFEDNSIFSPVFKCQIPSRPENPVIEVSNSRSEKGVTLKWHEPRQYSDILVTGYQVYNDDVIIGPVLHSNNLEAFLPLKLTANYLLKIEALTAQANISKIFSNTIETRPKPLKIRHKMIEICIKEVRCQSIEIGWYYLHPRGTQPSHYRVEWSSIHKPVPKIAILPNTISSYTIRECVPGKAYFIYAKAVGREERIIVTSTQLKVQTSAPPGNPQLNVQSLSSNAIILHWKRPTEYGVAKISSYSLFIDKESVEIEGSSNSFVYDTLPCKTHTFKMLANTDRLVGPSRLSNTLIVSTPGLKIPVPTQISSGKLDSIAFSWDSVSEIGNVKLFKLDVFCSPKLNEDAIAQIRGIYIVHPGCKCHVDMTSKNGDMFHSLINQSEYVVFLKATDTEGCEYFSDIVQMSTAEKIEAPNVNFTNLSLDKQNKIKAELIERINERDNLQLKLCWQQTKPADVRTTKGQKIAQEIAELSGALFSIENSILNRLKYLKSQSSLISVHLKWEAILETCEVAICGYEVLVNGCRESLLSKQQTNCTVEVNRTKLSETVSISLRALTDHPIGPGEESEKLLFDWDSDLGSFSYFCLNNIHSKDGGCLYLQTFDGERSIKLVSSFKDLITRGHFQSQTHPTKTKVWNLFQNRFETFPLRLHSGSLDFVLFWTFWCEPSQNALEFFVKFAEQNSEFMKFTCVCVNSGDKQDEFSHQSQLIDYLQSQFYDSSPVEFVCGCGDKVSPNPTRVFSIFGVPTFAIFHPTGTLGWIGRHTSKDFQDFESFFTHTANTVFNVGCEVENCDYCVQKNLYRSISHSYSFLSEKSRSIYSIASCRTTSATSTSKLRNSQKVSSVYSSKQKPKIYQTPKK